MMCRFSVKFGCFGGYIPVCPPPPPHWICQCSVDNCPAVSSATRTFFASVRARRVLTLSCVDGGVSQAGTTPTPPPPRDLSTSRADSGGGAERGRSEGGGDRDTGWSEVLVYKIDCA